jgi:hypothetical protein
MSATRNEVYIDSVLREVWTDNGDGTGTAVYYDEQGSVTLTENFTNLAPHVYPPLDDEGVLATLLVTLDVIPLQDAANAVADGDAAWLVAEAEAWSLGA